MKKYMLFVIQLRKKIVSVVILTFPGFFLKSPSGITAAPNAGKHFPGHGRTAAAGSLFWKKKRAAG